MNTYGELIRWLISEYEEGIENLPEDDKVRNQYLIVKRIHDGICNKSESIGIDIYFSEFSEEYTPYMTYLCQTPHLQTYENAKKYLQIRLDRLKKVLPKWDLITIESKAHE